MPSPFRVETATWMYVARAASEEQLMLDHFGNAYRDYMAHTGRLLPKLLK